MKFAEQSSVHGVKYVFGRVGQAKSTRVFFFCSLLLTFCGLSFYAFSAYHKCLVVPETVTRTRDIDSTDFPVPAITLCSDLFASGDKANFFKAHKKYLSKLNLTISELECKYFASNLQWCQPSMGFIFEEVCGMYDLKDLNVVEFINKSALQTNKMLYSCLAKPCDDFLVRIFTDFGVCYTFNMQGFNAIFNTEVIHDDFKCYMRKNHDNASDIQWTPEKGYPTSDSEFPQRAYRGHIMSHQPALSSVDKDNICALNAYRIFLHKPNEILTPFHESTFLKYDEYMEFSISIKSYRAEVALKSFAPQLRNCYFEGEKPLKYFKTYTKALCEFECEANQTLTECGCVKFSMPRGKDTPICTIKELKCSLELPAGECECLPACYDFRYSFRYDKAAFNRQFFQGSLPDNCTMSLVQFNMDFDFVEDVETLVSYKVQNFISDLGGLLGLFLGCSLISIVEMFYYMISVLMAYLMRLKSTMKDETLRGVIQVTPFRRNELQVSTYDQALNELARTVHSTNIKMEKKISKIEENYAILQVMIKRMEENIQKFNELELKKMKENSN